jgi:hypothetical protein
MQFAIDAIQRALANRAAIFSLLEMAFGRHLVRRRSTPKAVILISWSHRPDHSATARHEF